MSASALYNSWKNKYVRSEYSLGSQCKFIAFQPDGNSTTSESSGYGLLTAVLANDREVFDGILKFTDYFKNSNGLLSWKQERSGGRIVSQGGNVSSATDGDLDCVAALWIAHKRWGNQDYANRARAWGNAILDRAVNPSNRSILLGDWAYNDGTKKWVTRSSDFILAHLSMFARRHTERSGDWTAVLNTCKSIMRSQYNLNSNTGLVADFLQGDPNGGYRPSNGQVLEKPEDAYYNWNACRVPWRLAQYYLVSGDSSIKPHLDVMNRFFERANNGYIFAGYKLNGEPLVKYTSVAFLAPAAYLLQAMGSSKTSAVVNQINQLYSSNNVDYYAASIHLLTVLQGEQSAIELIR
ncbi:Six-hairpin glycosidase-like protein [Syncephalis plumigaleata]|nr:Six-hairpin glycosidase-like protein [Syncephalis plumigaleata]